MAKKDLVTVKELLSRCGVPEQAVDEVLDKCIKDEKVREDLKDGSIKVRESNITDEEVRENYDARTIAMAALYEIVRIVNEAWEEEQQHGPIPELSLELVKELRLRVGPEQVERLEWRQLEQKHEHERKVLRQTQEERKRKREQKRKSQEK
jgi:hypothetical protein